ncbi:MAG: DUF4256 domain-containing protein [Candidatus Thermoplasmatota archaeon]|nr:DUF4256 domain-containing protein [Candidatus Thermoplasmatota archaeon]
MIRHSGIIWKKIQARLEANAEKIWSLNEMERTGGAPDVVSYDEITDKYFFYDCSPESPAGRRSICYDGRGQEAREKQGIKPGGNAIDMAATIGIEILTDVQYRQLQKIGNFDTRTSSWLKTPPDIRKLGGAIFADRRYGTVFVYHNGASSFYSGRGFRGFLEV